MVKLNYKAAAKVMIDHGDFTTFTEVLKIAFPTYMAAAAGMNTTTFRERMANNFDFTEEQISYMAKHLDVTKKKMKELLENDRKKNRQ